MRHKILNVKTLTNFIKLVLSFVTNNMHEIKLNIDNYNNYISDLLNTHFPSERNSYLSKSQ